MKAVFVVALMMLSVSSFCGELDDTISLLENVSGKKLSTEKMSYTNSRGETKDISEYSMTRRCLSVLLKCAKEDPVTKDLSPIRKQVFVVFAYLNFKTEKEFKESDIYKLMKTKNIDKIADILKDDTLKQLWEKNKNDNDETRNKKQSD